MRALFINSNVPECGVHQYGLNLYNILKGSPVIGWEYWDLPVCPTFKSMTHFDFLLYNWQALIGGWIKDAPFHGLKRQVLCYHDCDLNESRWNAILFSDPTMPGTGKWHSIGRPLPEFKTIVPKLDMTQPIIGVHGFLGAWADQVVHRVMEEFEYATIRLQLPYSKFCDPDGAQARTMADRCRNMVSGHSGIALHISHAFLPQPRLLEWLAQNDINCYIRPMDMNWRGVSSAPDCALAVRKPVAVNRCNAFRHLHGLSPSICVEDTKLADIISNGLSPLVPIYNAWSQDNIRSQVESVLLSLH